MPRIRAAECSLSPTAWAASFARSSKTAASATSRETLARSRRCAAADRAVQLIRGSGPTAAACCARRTQPGPRRPTAQLCTNFRAPRPPASRPAGRPSRGPDQCVPVDPAPLGEHRQCGQADSRSSARRGCAGRSAAAPGTVIRPATRPPPRSCPMRLSVLAYHRRDNVPGQIRAQIGPLDHPPRSPRGQGPCDRNPPCNLTR